jgi:hypothetical protein
MGLFLTFCDGHHIGRSYGAAILALKNRILGGASSLGEIHNRQHQRVTGVSLAKTRLPTIGTVEPDA